MADLKSVNLVITDLDDTIWDWVNMWHSSFEPYIKKISVEYKIDIEVLKRDFMKLHRKYHTSEASFIYHELECLSGKDLSAFENPEGKKKSILHEYYSNKKKSLFLNDGVLETLKAIKESGAIIIGFTESKSFFTKYRIKHLNLDGILDYVYAPVDFEVPESVYKHYQEKDWEPTFTEFRYLTKETKKPAPEILEIILKDHQAIKGQTIYIGDKLNRDILMANQADITSVYAEYGHNIEDSAYELLKEVTHWTKEEVQVEAEFKLEHGNSGIADYTMDKSFYQLNDWFAFTPFPNAKAKNIEIDHILNIWNKIIDVQQHFNDIGLRIRNMAVTVFAFIAGAIGYVEKENLFICIKSFVVPYSSILSLIGTIILLAFFYMDRGWYHKLLLGAVTQGISLESKWGNVIPEIGLTIAIGKASPNNLFWGIKIHSKHKFFVFYGLLVVTLIFTGALILWMNNP